MGAQVQRLSVLTVGKSATVDRVELPAEARSRLLELGLVAGTPVQLVRFAPLGDPVEIKLRGSHLSLRRHEADAIWVRPGD